MLCIFDNTIGKMLKYNLGYSSLGSLVNGVIDASQNYYNTKAITTPFYGTYITQG